MNATPVTTKAGNRIQPPPPVLTESKSSRAWGDYVSRLGIIGVLIILVIVATLLSPGFLNPGNIVNVLAQNTSVGLIAIGMTFIIIAGGFDLSVAAILAAGAVGYASLSATFPVPVALLLTAVLGFILGSINAFLITKMKINAFIATLASASLFAGATLLYTNNQSIPLASKGGYDFLSEQDVFGVPLSVLLLAVVTAIGWFVLSKTTYGLGIYAIGGNNEAARLTGLRVGMLRASTFALTGVCAALGGVVVTSVIGVGQPGVEVDDTLNSIAIVVIGGTSLLGGQGAMWRTVVGILIFGTIRNLFDSLALPTAAQEIALGAIVIAAVGLDALTRNRRSRTKTTT